MVWSVDVVELKKREVGAVRGVDSKAFTNCRTPYYDVRLRGFRDFARFNAVRADLHTHCAACGTHDAYLLQIRIKATPCAIVGV
jgi:hypothetical protein